MDEDAWCAYQSVALHDIVSCSKVTEMKQLVLELFNLGVLSHVFISKYLNILTYFSNKTKKNHIHAHEHTHTINNNALV